MNRRNFVALAAAGAAAPQATAARLDQIPVRKVGKVEVVFDSPATKPNGLQATKEGLWIIDQGAGNQAHLVDYKNGKVIKAFETETQASSGITFDGEALWIGSTYSREIVRCSASTGKAIERRFTPGAGVIYKMAGDPPARSSPVGDLRKKAPPLPRRPDAPPRVGGFQMGEASSTAPGTGAHGQEWRDGKLWFCVPPSRHVYRINPKTWVVEKQFPTAGNRPHGIGWEGKYLWVTDSNLNAFFKHDVETGAMVEKIQLAENDPLPHGMTIWEGYMWYCDDIGIVCRLKL
ncbi:MAG: hypothetical protein FJW32_22615 [Acidobacteria bacterium]|nr:hypothetical protein [Acidobacteriota bacterium]